MLCTASVQTDRANRFSWVNEPELMDRLIGAQNALKTPIDIVTFAGMCGSREELERHVIRYEAQVASQGEA